MKSLPFFLFPLIQSRDDIIQFHSHRLRTHTKLDSIKPHKLLRETSPRHRLQTPSQTLKSEIHLRDRFPRRIEPLRRDNAASWRRRLRHRHRDTSIVDGVPVAVVGVVRDVQVEVVDRAGGVGGADVGHAVLEPRTRSEADGVGRRVRRYTRDGDLTLFALEGCVAGDDVPVEEVVDPERADCADDWDVVHCCFELRQGVSETGGELGG